MGGIVDKKVCPRCDYFSDQQKIGPPSLHLDFQFLNVFDGDTDLLALGRLHTTLVAFRHERTAQAVMDGGGFAR